VKTAKPAGTAFWQSRGSDGSFVTAKRESKTSTPLEFAGWFFFFLAVPTQPMRHQSDKVRHFLHEM
jgi:hypothetical protein